MSATRDPFSQFEYEAWERVAARYESAWSALTRLFIPQLIEVANIQTGTRVLDVACGPGYVAEAALAAGASPIGVDFSPQMVRLARARDLGVPFFAGDAQALAVDNDAFDAVLMNFGVLHFARPEAAFAEARRVLVPQGRLAFTVWASPEHSPGARVVEDAVATHAKAAAQLPKGPEYFGFESAEASADRLGRFGFDPASLIFRTVTANWFVPRATFVFDAERDAGVRTAALLAAQSPDVLAAVKAAIEAGLQPFATADGFSIPYAAHVIAVERA